MMCLFDIDTELLMLCCCIDKWILLTRREFADWIPILDKRDVKCIKHELLYIYTIER